ncbi:MAG: hypothetical protein L6425_05465 [Candidatus Aminicenantes bacterium]|nr:hypothetical protein [Candidatus Aminicenantes bacterium]
MKNRKNKKNRKVFAITLLVPVLIFCLSSCDKLPIFSDDWFTGSPFGIPPSSVTPPTVTKPDPSDIVPLLISPRAGAVLDNGRSDGRDDIVWDFDWSDINGATSYRLYVIGSNALYPVIDRPSNMFDSSYHHVSAGSYIIDENRLNWKWKVRAYANGVWSDWSEERTFDVEPLNTDPPN